MVEFRFLGIRHHGPGSARSLAAALDRFAPDVVVLEAPLDAATLLTRVGEADLRPPVALLAYVVDQPSAASFIPLASFSPEWVALSWARRHGVAVVPMDLAYTHVLGFDQRAALDGPGIDPVAVLARAAGEADPERWWDDLVEHRGGDDAFDAIAEAMCAVREGLAPPEGPEACREATMRTTIRAVLRRGFGRVAVVCGAWHVPALAPLGGAGGLVSIPTATQDAARLRGLPKVKVALTWVPWTNRRLAAATGYRAGVSAPGWYRQVFAYQGPELVARWFTDTARLLRAHDHAVSPDHVVSATRLAEALASLRERPAVGLDEVEDAALAVVGGGRAGPLALVREHLVIGDDIGRVPTDVAQVPLARDVAVQSKRLRLRPEGTRRVLELDLRAERDRQRSQFLHRLNALGLTWASAVSGRRSLGTFRETWELCWEPEVELQLVDASVYGTTVAVAARQRLVERARQAPSLADLAALVEVVLVAGLDEAVEDVMDVLARRAATDADTATLIDALVPLARIVRYGDVRATAAPTVAAVVDGLVQRICAGVVPACARLDDLAAAAMAGRLGAVQASLALIDHVALHGAWPAALGRVEAMSGLHEHLHGALARLCLDAGYWPVERVARTLAKSLGPTTAPADGAAFVEGFLESSGTVLVHDATLRQLIDTWVCGLDTDTFSVTLPLLRRTFGSFETSERRRLGELLARRGDGREPAPFGWDLDPDRVRAAAETVAELLGVTP